MGQTTKKKAKKRSSFPRATFPPLNSFPQAELLNAHCSVDMVTSLTGTFSSSNPQFMSKAAKVNHINFKRTFHSCGIKSPRRDITGPRIQNTEATNSLDLNHTCLGTKTHIPEDQTFWKEPLRPLCPQGVLFFPAPQNDSSVSFLSRMGFETALQNHWMCLVTQKGSRLPSFTFTSLSV